MDAKYYPLVNKMLGALKIRERVESQIISQDDAYISPFITIAREPGSGGSPIAKAVANKLGFEYLDEQIIDEISRSTKKRRAIIKEIDEKSRTIIENIVHSVINPEYVDENTYVSELVKYILTKAYNGKVVILGRGANFFTPFARGLHVNITAPYDVRVKRAIDFEGHTKEIAKEVIAKVEDERKSFVKQYFRKDINKVNSYDLSINTTYFRVNEARDVIIEAFFQKFSRSLKKEMIVK